MTVWYPFYGIIEDIYKLRWYSKAFFQPSRSMYLAVRDGHALPKRRRLEFVVHPA